MSIKSLIGLDDFSLFNTETILYISSKKEQQIVCNIVAI